MSAADAEAIHATLTHLMEGVRDNPSLTAEIARAEREFFHANPKALNEDVNASLRFREWYLLERDSEVLGDVPLIALPMSDDEREILSDSLVGVFLITELCGPEYVISDLQAETTHDLAVIDEIDLAAGDLVIGRLFEGSLDTYVASPALACQREGRALAEAFLQDILKLGVDRRLTQAELEHLLFRGRGATDAEGTATAVPTVPLEHLEADLEQVLLAGGIDVDELSATAISAALRGIPQPGMVADPLLEQIAFDTTVDIVAAQRLMLSIWQHHQSNPKPLPPATQEDAATDDDGGGEAAAAAEPATATPQPPSAESTSPNPATDRIVEAADSGDAVPGLGADIAARITQGLTDHEDLAKVFADAEKLVGEPEVDDEVDAESPVFENLRPLITEYLWETGGEQGPDVAVLEQLVVTQSEAPLPRLDIESVTSGDLVRLLLHIFLGQPPGERSGAVGAAFAVLQRFFGWIEATQAIATTELLATADADVVQHAARLETAAMSLSSGAADPTGQRALLRVIAVHEAAIEVAGEDDDQLVRVPVTAESGANLRVDDLLLGMLQRRADGAGTFAGMVVAVPAVARDLLG